MKNETIKILKDTIIQWIKEYDILDSIIDMKDAVIAELKAENERLKEELDFLKNNPYREALREIREYIEMNTDFDKGDKFLSETPAYDILVILALYGE